MNRILSIVGLSTCLVAYSCTKTSLKEKQAVTQTASTELKADNLVKTTVTNQEGISLEMSFNNANQMATFVLNGKVIELKQDTVASGIQYSNANYVYREHQGEITLTKDGKAVFTHRK